MLVLGKYPVFGAVPQVPTASDAPTHVIGPQEITDRVLKVGPFMLNPAGDVLEFSLAQFATRYPAEYSDFIEQLGRVSAEACKYAHMYMGGPAGAGCFPRYKGIRPTSGLVYKRLADGEYPLYRVENPIHPGEQWGLYVEFIGDGDQYGDYVVRRLKITFRKVPQSWWSKLWGFLKALVGVIVSLVKDILEGFLKGLCAQAQAAGQQLADVAAGKAQLTTDMKSQFNSYGVSNDILMKFAGGGLTSTMLRSVAGSIAGSLCAPFMEQYPPGSFAVFTGVEYRIFVPSK